MIASPIRPRSTDRNRASLPRASSPHPRNALRRFTSVRHHNASTASSRPALTEAPQRKQPHWNRPVNSGPRPCLIDVGFPLSGPQSRTSTSDLNAMPGTLSSAYGLASAALSHALPAMKEASLGARAPACHRRSELEGGPSSCCTLVGSQSPALDYCLLDEQGGQVEAHAAPPDADGLAGLVRGVERRRGPVAVRAARPVPCKNVEAAVR